MKWNFLLEHKHHSVLSAFRSVPYTGLLLFENLFLFIIVELTKNIQFLLWNFEGKLTVLHILARMHFPQLALKYGALKSSVS